MTQNSTSKISGDIVTYRTIPERKRNNMWIFSQCYYAQYNKLMQANFISNQCKAYHPPTPTIVNYTFRIYLMLLRGKTNTSNLNLALWSIWRFLINSVPSIQFPRRHQTMKFHVLPKFSTNLSKYNGHN